MTDPVVTGLDVTTAGFVVGFIVVADERSVVGANEGRTEGCIVLIGCLVGGVGRFLLVVVDIRTVVLGRIVVITDWRAFRMAVVVGEGSLVVVSGDRFPEIGELVGFFVVFRVIAGRCKIPVALAWIDEPEGACRRIRAI